MSSCDTAFQVSASNLPLRSADDARSGNGSGRHGLAADAAGDRSCAGAAATGAAVHESLRSARVEYEVFNAVEVEPTDESFQAAIAVAREGQFDSFVAVGGGSTIDTAKAANLYSTYPADFLDYVNAPIGRGLPVPGAAQAADRHTHHGRDGERDHRRGDLRLCRAQGQDGHRPSLPAADAGDRRSGQHADACRRRSPPAAGLDVLSHALESYTAIPFNERPRPERPLLRPAYQGANPISDLWSLRALEMVAEFLPAP